MYLGSHSVGVVLGIIATSLPFTELQIPDRQGSLHVMTRAIDGADARRRGATGLPVGLIDCVVRYAVAPLRNC
jgi:hypothetical protein